MLTTKENQCKYSKIQLLRYMELTFESFPKSRIPEYQCIHIQAFFSPNSFLPQALHDMDLEMRATPYVVVIVVSLGTLPTCSME